VEHAEMARSTYEDLMEKTKLIVQRKPESGESPPTEELYAVLHLTVDAEGTNGGDRHKDLGMVQLGISRFLAVVAQIVDGWGGKLIEASRQSYTAIFPISEPGAIGRCCICGIQILQAIDNAVNPSLAEEGVKFAFRGGVGISMGPVYGFDTGLTSPANSLYYGEAMASAVEYANMTDGSVIVDKKVKEHVERASTEFKVRFHPYRYHEWVGYRFDVG